MSDINLKFKTIRISLRRYGKNISEDVFKRFHPSTKYTATEICVFCNSTSDITKEHVLPKWVFEYNTIDTIISSVNRQIQTYNKVVIPTCAECNNSLLSGIERHIYELLQKCEGNDVPTTDDLSNIIRWLEILDYKYQVYDCRRKYIKYGNSEYSKHFGDIPVAWMRHFDQMNPFKALSYLRNAQRRICVRSKKKRINSLVILEPEHPELNFFSQPNEYIFVSFPMFKIAIFYFLRKEFTDNDSAYKEALYVLTKVFES